MREERVQMMPGWQVEEWGALIIHLYKRTHSHMYAKLSITRIWWILIPRLCSSLELYDPESSPTHNSALVPIITLKYTYKQTLYWDQPGLHSKSTMSSRPGSCQQLRYSNKWYSEEAYSTGPFKKEQVDPQMNAEESLLFKLAYNSL